MRPPVDQTPSALWVFILGRRLQLGPGEYCTETAPSQNGGMFQYIVPRVPTIPAVV